MTYVVSGFSRTSSSCENIGPAERRKRVRIAAVSLAVAALVAVSLVAFEAHRGWRLLALPPIWIGALCLVEAKTRTCVVLAARGVRNMDAGDEPITDAAERRMVGQQSRSVHIWTLLLTILLIGALFLVP